MESAEGLPFQDNFNLSRLKRFRARSLANPAWLRDADAVLSYLRKGTVPTADGSWPEGSPLIDLIERAVTATKDFRAYVARVPAARSAGRDEGGDDRWAAVLRALDDLIAEAERRKGGPLSYRP